jgi:hypothetical protein
VPEAVGLVISSGIAVPDLKGFLASLRLRYFGPRDLTSDGIYRSQATALLNGEVGYRIGERWRVTAEGLNLLDRSDHDIDYAYKSPDNANSHAGVHGRFPPCRTVSVSIRIRKNLLTNAARRMR